MNAKSKRKDAERAAVWFAMEHLGTVIYRKAIQAQWQKVDFFGSDIVAKYKNGVTVYIQVTAGQDQAITARKRKLEAIPWHYEDKVYLLQLKQRQGVVNARRKEWFFKVWEYAIGIGNERTWELWPDPVSIPSKWFKSYKPEVW